VSDAEITEVVGNIAGTDNAWPLVTPRPRD
jgi:hypothetical protein